MAANLNLPRSIASCSIGLPKHTLHQKIEALCQHGFTGIELAFPDLVSFATLRARRDVAPDDYNALCEAGEQVRKLCEGHNVKLVMLQPFSNFEGWPRGGKEREDAFKRARGWIQVMEAVGTDLLQVGSSDSEGVSSSVEEVAADIAELGDMLAEKGFRLAYENWCWATHAPNWKDVWTVVKEANRPNVGLCLDTFQTAGGEWGDPRTKSGRIETGGVPEKDLDMSYKISLQELSRTVPGDKIFILQISDAYHVSPPIDKPDESGLRPRGRWSHDQRPLPYDGGYLPIAQFLEAVLATGFRSWLSVEVFDGKFEEKYGDDLGKFAEKAKEGLDKLLNDVDEKRILTGLD